MRTSLSDLPSRVLISTVLLAAVLTTARPIGAEMPVGTAFTYQGELQQGGSAVNDTCEFQFSLWDDGDPALPENQVGATLSEMVVVEDGRLAVVLDFGADIFAGSARWLEIAVCCPPDDCSMPPTDYTILSPRQELTPIPYALHAANAPDGHSLDAADGDPVDALFVDNEGFVGIGTQTPTRELEVVGVIQVTNPGSSPDGSSIIMSSPGGDIGLILNRGDGAGGVQRRWDIAVGSSQALEIKDKTFGADRLVIKTSGNVGIGTPVPGQRLTVAGTVESTTGGFKFPDGTVQATAAISGGDSPWVEDSDDISYVAGSVGIGTTGPFGVVPLDVLNIKTATLPSARDRLACALDPISEKIYCFGGSNSTTDEIVEYDPATDTLTTMTATLPSARNSLACATDAASGMIYCFGGVDPTRVDEIVQYDPATDTLTTMTATLPSARHVLACAGDEVSGRIYCFGGNAIPGALDEIVEYDPATDTLTTMTATLPSARHALACAGDEVSGRIYCFGGQDLNNDKLDEIIEYDPATDSLVTSTATLPSARYFLACAVDLSTGKIYCFGGLEDGARLDEIVEYDPVTDTLATMQATLPAVRQSLACAPNGGLGNIYCFGGSDGPSVDEVVAYAATTQILLQVGEQGDGTGAFANSWSVFSSRTFKRDIAALEPADYEDILAKLNATDAVRYSYNHDARRTVHLGVIAEDSPSEILAPGGMAVSLGDFTTFLMVAIKAQQDLIERNDAEIAATRSEMEDRLAALEKKLVELTANGER